MNFFNAKTQRWAQRRKERTGGNSRFALRLGVLAMLLGASAHACSIPVFRYSLERWEPELFEITVFHDGPLTEEQRQLVERLKRPGKTPVRWAVSDGDIHGQLTVQQTRLWAKLKGQTLPRLAAGFPSSNSPDDPLAFAGALDDASVELLRQSPARVEISKKLLAGDSIVFVLLTGSDAARNAAAEKTLADELPSLEKTILLPQDDQESLQDGANEKARFALPLAVRFSSVTLRRDDPREAAFVSMLTALDASYKANVPVVFPLFGRGRALTGLTGKDLRPEVLEEAAVFLCGACSCRFKELSPGTDMLFDVDWEGILEVAGEAPAAPVVKKELPKRFDAALAPLPAESAEREFCPIVWRQRRWDMWRALIGASVFAGLLTGFMAWRHERRRAHAEARRGGAESREGGA
jgi:hypothetical protein